MYFFNNHQSDKMFIENIKFEKKYKDKYLVFSENKVENFDHIEKERNFILKK